MSSQTQDNVVFEKMSAVDIMEKPFVRREWTYIEDTNRSGFYPQNQVVFDTTSSSSNGKYNDYSQGVLSFPWVIHVSGVTPAPAPINLNGERFDPMLTLKNSNYN